MSAARTGAARLRGWLIGALSGAVAVVAHATAGGALSSGACVVLLILACGTVGAVASSALRRANLLGVVAFLTAGQLSAHLILVVTSDHGHAGHWSLSMLLAHLVATAACALLICAAEHLFAVVATELRRLFVFLLTVRADDDRPRPLPVWPHACLAVRDAVCGRLRTRAPPLPVA